jgi:hypothetical protein
VIELMTSHLPFAALHGFPPDFGDLFITVDAQDPQLISTKSTSAADNGFSPLSNALFSLLSPLSETFFAVPAIIVGCVLTLLCELVCNPISTSQGSAR